MTNILRSRVLSSFSCLGDACEDTCCQRWSMQVDEQTVCLYRDKAPELLQAVEPAAETPWIMRKDPTSGFCVKLEDGLCGIHKTYGPEFLGDACYFYPRATRRLGAHTLMTGALSCPEIVRLMLKEDAPGAMEKASAERLPHSLKDYVPEDMREDDALAVHNAFLRAAQDEHVGAERLCLRIASASRWLERTEKKDWAQAAPFFLEHNDMHIPPAAVRPEDPFNLLHALCGLIVASRKPPPPRLKQTIDAVERALAVRLDWDQVAIHTSDGSLNAYHTLQAQWQAGPGEQYAPLLRRWLQMQLALALYPFAGLGQTLSERITIIGVRLATLRLALMSGADSLEAAVRITQSLARFLDHLADPAFSLQVYSETGWVQEDRLHGLLAG